jgi:hypothetical protein
MVVMVHQILEVVVAEEVVVVMYPEVVEVAWSLFYVTVLHNNIY